VHDALLSQPIVALDESHDRRSFNCGVDSLDRYFHVQAGQDHRRHIAVCFVLLDRSRSRIAGYYTVSAFSIVGDELPAALQKKLPKYSQIPCTLLGRLAVDLQYRTYGIGKHLLVDALKRALIHSVDIASWAVVVDAKDAVAVAFYVRHGFISLPKSPGRLFLPMATVAALFS
jgi:GNAT superfamily N-acetyltransferase